ncbi:MAG: nucleotidyltransferase domain-containing protein [Gemmatimonadales bacterium]
MLFGRTRREVLALLFGRPEQRYYLREILRAVGSGTGAVQRELQQLVAAGLVSRNREGRQVYFSANPRSVIFGELRAIVEKTAGTADVLRTELATALAGDKIVVAFIYGSVARGDQTATSDVDLMVVGDLTLAEILPAIRAAESRLGREVNPSLFPVSEYKRGSKRGSAFLKRVVAGSKLFLKGDDRELARLAR